MIGSIGVSIPAGQSSRSGRAPTASLHKLLGNGTVSRLDPNVPAK